MKAKQPQYVDNACCIHIDQWGVGFEIGEVYVDRGIGSIELQRDSVQNRVRFAPLRWLKPRETSDGECGDYGKE